MEKKETDKFFFPALERQENRDSEYHHRSSYESDYEPSFSNGMGGSRNPYRPPLEYSRHLSKSEPELGPVSTNSILTSTLHEFRV